MNNIVKATIHGAHRVHASNANHAPVCGGGNSARQANWQEDIGGITCLRCISIIASRATPPPRNPHLKPNRRQHHDALS